MSRIGLIAALLAATLARSSTSTFAGSSVHIYGTSGKNCLFKKP